MPSRSLVGFSKDIQSGNRIRQTAGDERLRPISLAKKRVFLHASLAAYVAAWDSYLNNVVREFREATRKPLDQEYSALHGDLEKFVSASLKRFNTPNAENARRILMDCTGFDPINDWKWPRGHLNATETRDFLDEIIKVRHSFAHGFPMPAYDWTTTPTGQRRLTIKSLERVEVFLNHLVKETDRGLGSHGGIAYRSSGVSIWELNSNIGAKE